MKLTKLKNEEIEFLYKCISRLHKENGTFIAFKQLEYNSKFNFFNKAKTFEGDVNTFLVQFVWNLFYEKNIHDCETVAISQIKASLTLLNLIDFLNKSDKRVFKTISTEMYSSEFSFIDSILSDNSSLLENSICKEINEIWNKYNHLYGAHLLNIPTD